ncbi:SCO4848 family membrane protein [Kitasatospora sp. NPDC086801]|uniref:SCO4848 family membrane protein n=1 Tax=Kitasatospora sp. NPDC086801 TaxID=3364066 RepID=UPI00382C8278
MAGVRSADRGGTPVLLGGFPSTTFVKNLWKDSGGQAFTNGDHSQPTAFFWIHLLLAVTSFLLGIAVGAIGVRGLRATRRTPATD